MKICVFGASSEQIEKIYIDTAESLGRAIANRGDAVIYGAGKYGVMGATARGVTSEKGELIGVAPEFFKKDNVLYDKCTELVFTDTMRERKGVMEDRADAFVICAGGIGTFEEFFENSIKYEMYNNIPKQGYQQFLANDLDPKFSSGFSLINKSTIKCKMHLFR